MGMRDMYVNECTCVYVGIYICIPVGSPIYDSFKLISRSTRLALVLVLLLVLRAGSVESTRRGRVMIGVNYWG